MGSAGLKLRPDLRQLLDGYESREMRQRHRRDIYIQEGEGDNVAGDLVGRDKYQGE